MTRKLLTTALGTLSILRDVISCAITGREPAWIARVAPFAAPPVTARPDDEAWAGLSSRLWPATTVGRA